MNEAERIELYSSRSRPAVVSPPSVALVPDAPRFFAKLLQQPGLAMLDEQEFRMKADAALEGLYNALVVASDEHGFECDFDGAVKLEFEEPSGKFVVSPNSPVRQIWVSAHSKSYKLDWDPSRAAFVLSDSGQTLTELMEDAVSRQIGTEVRLG